MATLYELRPDGIYAAGSDKLIATYDGQDYHVLPKMKAYHGKRIALFLAAAEKTIKESNQEGDKNPAGNSPVSFSELIGKLDLPIFTKQFCDKGKEFTSFMSEHPELLPFKTELIAKLKKEQW